MKRTYRKAAKNLVAGDVIALVHKATDPYDIMLYTVVDTWDGNGSIIVSVDYQQITSLEPTHTTLQLDRDQVVTMVQPAGTFTATLGRARPAF